ncbi:hypothetical protein DFJ74DRAFT_664381, partial [Hyaloraphidium curvatum]
MQRVDRGPRFPLVAPFLRRPVPLDSSSSAMGGGARVLGTAPRAAARRRLPAPPPSRCFAATPIHAADAMAGPPPSNQSVFYQNRLFERYWSQEPRRVTLRQLCVHGRNLTPAKLVASANYVRNELPVRLSHRIRDFQALPFVVGTDPNISRVYELYMNAFESFRRVPEIKTMEDNEAFCALLAQQLYTHLEVIPLLAKGMVEAATARHMDASDVDRFMYTTLRSRIGRRVIAEQHIALTRTYLDEARSGTTSDNSPFIGIVNTRTRAGTIVERCAALARKVFVSSYGGSVAPPEIVVDGDVDAEFTYIPDQAEYVVYELLENAMRFTLYEHHPHFHRMRQTHASAIGEISPKPWVQASAETGESKPSPLSKLVADPGSIERFERGGHTHPQLDAAEPVDHHAADGDVVLPPVRITCALSPSPTSAVPTVSLSGAAATASAAASFSPIIAFRISDRGGGIPRPLVPHIFSFAHASKFREFPAVVKRMKGVISEKEREAVGLAHLGIGLPLSKVYAEFWGGTLSVRVIEGWGTDVYVRLGLGNRLENLV